MPPFLKKISTYIKREHYSNFCTFEIASLLNVPRLYLRKYGICNQYSVVKGGENLLLTCEQIDKIVPNYNHFTTKLRDVAASCLQKLVFQLLTLQKKVQKQSIYTKDFQAFRVGLVRRLPSAKVCFLFMV